MSFPRIAHFHCYSNKLTWLAHFSLFCFVPALYNFLLFIMVCYCMTGGEKRLYYTDKKVVQSNQNIVILLIVKTPLYVLQCIHTFLLLWCHILWEKNKVGVTAIYIPDSIYHCQMICLYNSVIHKRIIRLDRNCICNFFFCASVLFLDAYIYEHKKDLRLRNWDTCITHISKRFCIPNTS